MSIVIRYDSLSLWVLTPSLEVYSNYLQTLFSVVAPLFRSTSMGTN
jgi:hypothetical protein